MHRTDTSPFLLYLEPPKEEKSEISVDDEITQIMQVALSEAKSGISNYSETNEPPQFVIGHGYKGYHITDCGNNSTGNDYLLENGMITNSLAVYYLQYYRSSIPISEMKKVIDLAAFYKNKYPQTLELVIIKVAENSNKDWKTRLHEFFEENEI